MPSPEIRFGMSGMEGHVRRIAEYAAGLEELGYEFVGVGEHVMMGSPPIDTYMSLPSMAVAAGATKRMRLLSSVSLPSLYPPALLAKEITTLDIASNGRVIYGLGVGGDSPHDFRSVGITPDHRGSRTDEAIAIMKRLWMEESVSFQGRFYQLDDIAQRPHPVQKPHPPLWVGGRQEAAMRRAARFGDGWLPYLYTPERYKRSVEVIRETAALEGRDLAGFQWALNQHVILGDSQEEALKLGTSILTYRSHRDPRDIVRSYWTCGTPKDIIRGLETMVDAGVRVFSFIAPRDQSINVLDYARTLSEKVIPYFKG